MKSVLQLSLLAASTFAALGVASSATAQSYGYAPPPPPPPILGQVFQRDDRYVDDAGTQNTDGSYGYRNYLSRPDTTPDDPQGYAYQAQKTQRFGGYDRYADDEGYAPPPPRYIGRGYGAPDDGYAPRYADPRQAAAPRHPDAYDDEEAAPPQPPRYAQPGYGAADQPPPYGRYPQQSW